MTNKIEISRELVERIVKTCSFTLPELDYQELRALLAAPVVERQEPGVSEADLIAAGFGYPMSKEDAMKAYKASLQPRTDHPSNEDCEWCHGAGHDYQGDPCDGCCKPAPVAVVLPERRVQPNGFTGKGWAELRGWNACLDKVKELNQ